MPEVIFFFASEASKQRSKVRREALRKSPSRLPSEPAKRLIFTPAIRQQASGTRVIILYKVVITFQSVGEILMCDPSNESC